MYIVTLYNDNQRLEIHNQTEKLYSGQVVKGINTIDSFSFSLLPSNVGFYALRDFMTLVSVYNTRKKRYEFWGRVLCSTSSMSESGLITKDITCESFFGFFCDSLQTYVNTQNWTVKGLLQHILDVHNGQLEESKHFVLGEVTAEDNNDNLYLGIQRKNTWETLKEKLLDNIGGEFRFRVVDGVTYLDYLQEIGETRTTAIALSRNMKAITKELDPTSLVTRLYPLGAKLNEDSEERLTIAEVNNGLEYIDDVDAIAMYGLHVGYVEYDDVKVASNLLRKGKEWLTSNNKVPVKYSITALDLSLLGLDIDDFDVCNYHPIKNALLGIDDVARIIKKTIDVCEEVKSTIEVGENFKTLSDIQREQYDKIVSAGSTIEQLQSTTNKLQEEVKNTSSGLGDLSMKVEGIAGTFFYIRYSANADGSGMTAAPVDDTEYMGTCSTNTETAPTDPAAYTWVKVKGNDGKAGATGAKGDDGKTSYLHIKYSDDGETFTADDGETLGAWIGTLVDFTEADSLTFSDYTWKKFTEDVDDELEEIRQEMVEQRTSVINDAEKIVFSALERYVLTSNYEEFVSTVSSQLQLLSDELSLQFTRAMEEIASVDGDLQTKYSTITKYFTFDINGLTIGQADSPYKVVIDNDRYSMLVNGAEVLWIANGEVYAPEITITHKMQLFGFQITQDDDGTINCDYIGGD